MDCSELVAAAVHSSGNISFPNTTRLQVHYLKRDNPGEFGAANENGNFTKQTALLPMI